MSASTIYSRRRHNSPSCLTYRRIYCTCAVASSVSTTILVYSEQPNKGKLYYSCARCRKHKGWCIPMVGRNFMSRAEYLAAGPELPYPGLTYKSQSPYYYAIAACSCSNTCAIKVSETDANPGKLYHCCLACDCFVAWCVPVNLNVEGQQEPVEAPPTMAPKVNESRTMHLLIICNLVLITLVVILIAKM